MAQQDILDYIRKTPHNSNVNVVKGMLNAEGGGGGAEPLIVNVVDDSEHAKMVFDKTWNEVKTAFSGGQSVVLSVSDSSSDEFYQAIQVISKAKYDTPAYNVQTSTSTYVCDTADGYPEYYYGD